MTQGPWSRLLGYTKDISVLHKLHHDMDGSRSYGKTLKSLDKFSKDPKDCSASFTLQRLTYQAASVGSYGERCGTDNEISVK